MEIYIENSQHKIWKYKSEYKIQNNSLATATYEIRPMPCGEVEAKIFEVTVEAEGVKTFELKYDATFGVYLDGVLVAKIDHYENTIDNFVTYIDSILCGCKCNTCNDCDGKGSTTTEYNLRALALANAYYIVHYPKHETYFNCLSQDLKCSITTDMLCQVNNMTFTGESDDSFFIKRLLAYYYLTFYIKESMATFDEEEALYVREKFNYKKIKPCIIKLGINPAEMLNCLLSGMEVVYWQFDTIAKGMPTVIFNWSANYLNNLPGANTQTIETFETGFIVPYTDVGKVGFGIRETDLENFSIADSLGNDVTDEFDEHYFETEKTMVFVSKQVYAHSNIYFKFKKNIYV